MGALGTRIRTVSIKRHIIEYNREYKTHAA